MTNNLPRMDVRICPSCNLPMTEAKHEEHVGYIIPMIRGTYDFSVDVNCGFPVDIFVCPKCGFVKLYDMRRGNTERK